MAAADDVRLMLATSSDTFAAGGISSPCFFSSFDDEVQTDNFGGAKQIVRRSFVLVCADDFPNLYEDDQALVNATSYTVLSTQLIQDGQMMQVNLQRVKGQ
jgi:hypothetical protein